MNGINYGHHWKLSDYNGELATQELQLLLRAGFKAVRVAYPPFDNNSIIFCKDIVTRALSLGFDKVIWGVVSSGVPVTATRWTAFKNYVTNDLANWAQNIGDSRLTISIGNEEELHVDDTNEVSTAECQSDLLEVAASVKSVYTIGQVDYTTDGSQRAAWHTQGLGSLDRIGFNVYYEWSPVISFRSSMEDMKVKFGSKVYISEWGTSSGFNDAATFGLANAERHWASNLALRQRIINDLGLDNFYFVFADGSFGVTANKWALRKTDGSYRDAWYRLTGGRLSSNAT